MAITQYYVSPASGNDTTGNGSSGTPWATVQKALNTITRNATDGDQINVQAGGTDTLSAALSLATYGTPTAAAPLIIRGYTSAANDGGIGVISGGGNYAVLSNYALDHVYLLDLHLTNAGSNFVVQLHDYCAIVNCEIDTNGGDVYSCVQLTGLSRIERCYVHDAAAHGIKLTGAGQALYNYVEDCGDAATKYQISLEGVGAQARENVCRAPATASGIYANSYGGVVSGNTIRSATNGAGKGLNVAGVSNLTLINNVIEGFSGAGGTGITFNAAAVCALYH